MPAIMLRGLALLAVVCLAAAADPAEKDAAEDLVPVGKNGLPLMAAGESPATLPPTPAEKAAQAVAQTAVAAKNSQKPENQPVVSDNFTKAMKENDFSYSLAGQWEPVEYAENCKKLFSGSVQSCWFGDKKFGAWVKNRCVIGACKPIGPSLVEWVTDLTNNTKSDNFTKYIQDEMKDEQSARKNKTVVKKVVTNATCNGQGAKNAWMECVCYKGSGFSGANCDVDMCSDHGVHMCDEEVKPPPGNVTINVSGPNGTTVSINVTANETVSGPDKNCTSEYCVCEPEWDFSPNCSVGLGPTVVDREYVVMQAGVPKNRSATPKNLTAALENTLKLAISEKKQENKTGVVKPNMTVSGNTIWIKKEAPSGNASGDALNSSVKMKMGLSIDFAWVKLNAKEFTDGFKADMGAMLDVARGSIMVTTIEGEVGGASFLEAAPANASTMSTNVDFMVNAGGAAERVKQTIGKLVDDNTFAFEGLAQLTGEPITSKVLEAGTAVKPMEMKMAYEQFNRPVNCPRHTHCKDCTDDPLCGWCRSTGKCMAGVMAGPLKPPMKTFNGSSGLHEDRQRFPTLAAFLQMDAAMERTTGVWGLAKGGAIMYRQSVTKSNPAGLSWKNVEGSMIKMFVGKEGNVWGLGAAGEKKMIYKRDGISSTEPTGTAWKATELVNVSTAAVGGSGESLSLWGITQTGNNVVHSSKLQPTEKWAGVGNTSMKSIFVSPDGLAAWGITTNGDAVVRKRITPSNPAGDEWVTVPGYAPLSAMAVAAADLKDTTADRADTAADVTEAVRLFTVQIACGAAKDLFKFPSFVCDKCVAGKEEECLNYNNHTEMFEQYMGSCLCAEAQMGCFQDKDFTSAKLGTAINECRMTDAMGRGASGKDAVREHNIMAIKSFMNKGPTSVTHLDCSCVLAKTCKTFVATRDADKLKTAAKTCRASGKDTTRVLAAADKSKNAPVRGIKSITVGNDGRIWAVTEMNEILYRFDVTPALVTGSRWKLVTGKLATVSQGNDGAVWAVGTDGIAFTRSGITAETPDGTAWAKVKSNMPIIAAFAGPDVSFNVPVMAAPAQATPAGEFKSANNKFCADFGTDRGSLFDCTKTDFQKFYSIPVNGTDSDPAKPEFKLKSLKPDRCMTANEQSISMAACSGARTEQLWSFVVEADKESKLKLVKIVSKTGQCVDVQDSEAIKGKELVLKDCMMGVRSQLWFFPSKTMDPNKIKTSVPVADIFAAHNTDLTGFDFTFDPAYGEAVCPGEFLYDKCIGSHCPDYTDCTGCAQDKECGWCGMDGGKGHCVRGGLDGPRGQQCCVDATGKPKFERMCDNPAKTEEGGAQCLVCMHGDKSFFREAGGFWATMSETFRSTHSPNKFMPAFEVDRVCRKKGSLPVAQHLPVMKVPLPCTGDDCQGSRSPLQFARDQAKQEAKDRMDAGWEKYMDGK